MIEATITEIGHGVGRRTRNALLGTRCSFSLVEDRRFMVEWKKAIIDIVLTPRKNSRIRKELYSGTYLMCVKLDDIADDGYELD